MHKFNNCLNHRCMCDIFYIHCNWNSTIFKYCYTNNCSTLKLKIIRSHRSTGEKVWLDTNNFVLICW